MIDFIRIRPQIVNLHFPDYQLVECYLLQKLFRFKLIMSLHGDEVVRMERLNKSTLRYFLYKDLFTSSIYITGCSKYLLDKFHNIFPSINRNKCITLLNGVNENFIYQSLNENKSNYIFSAGRFVHKKGFDLLFKAFSNIKSEVIYYAGFNQINSELNKVKEKSENRIKLLGEISRMRMMEYLSQCKLTIIPSRDEPYGIVVAEAICSGSPLLATEVGGIPEIIEMINSLLSKDESKIFQKYVKLVNPNIDSLYNGILEILNNKNQYIEYLAIVKKVRKVFLWENRLTEYESVLNAQLY